MQRIRDVLALVLIAAALPGASLVLGQAPALSITIRQEAKAEAKPAAKAEAKAAPREMRKAAVVRRARALPAQVLDAQAKQFVEQFRPIGRAEYYFVKHVAGLNAEQRKELAKASESAVRAAARQFVEAHQQMMQNFNRNGGYPDPHKLVEEEIVKAAGFLTAEQRARYQLERELRAASRRKVFIDNLVAKLDAEMVLTQRQREQAADALAANWKDQWGSSLDMLMNIDHFFPNIPTEIIAPILTEKQQAVWRRLPRNQGAFFGFGGMMFGDPDPLDDPELLDARTQAEAQEKQ